MFPAKYSETVFNVLITIKLQTFSRGSCLNYQYLDKSGASFCCQEAALIMGKKLHHSERRGGKLAGENPKVVWVKFSTLRKAFLLHSNSSAWDTYNHF
jgi:hypothetical protein